MSARFYQAGQGFDLPLLHKVGTYVLVALALLTLWTGKAFGAPLALVAVIIMVISWFWEKPRIDPDAFGTMWTGLTVFYIAFSVYLLAMTDTGVVSTGVYLVLYLTGAKLFQRSRLDDYVQLLALSFLLLAAATAYNEDVLFGAIFAIYVVVGVVNFAVYHLRRQLEENIERGGRRTRQHFGAGYLSVLASMSLVCFAAAVVFFFAFPRLGFGFFAQKSRTGLQMSGFSESVDLGKHGAIKDDNTVAMRVEFPDGKPTGGGTFYWRGISFDHYDGVGWSARLRKSRTLQPNADWQFKLLKYSGPPEQLVQQDIYVEPLGSNVMFTLYPAVEVALSAKDKAVPAWLRSKGVRLEEGEVLRMAQASKVGVQYSAWSYNGGFPPDEVRKLLTANPDSDLGPRYQNAYTQLPGANARIRKLTEGIIAGLDNDYDRTVAVEKYLKTKFTYTTDLPDPGAEAPLDAFLFTHQRGHCEYFATAMAVMLRSVGIPTRNVNGFMGGVWNEFDDFLAVRNADAHSWVEVWMGDAGWVPFDPTPPAANVSIQTSFFDEVAKFYDSLRFRWMKYVIEYDLETQVDLLRQAAGALGGGGEDNATADGEKFQLTLLDILHSVRRNYVPMLLVFIVAFLGALGIRLRGRDPVDWRDVPVVLITVGLGFVIVLVLWKPSAGWMARSYGAGVPIMALLWALAFRRRPAGRGRTQNREGIAKLYERLLGILENAGLQRRPAEGPEAVLRRVERSQLPSKPAIKAVIDRYMAVRFGGAVLGDGELRQLSRDLKDIKKSLK
mgnify:CR=1 FL=1